MLTSTRPFINLWITLMAIWLIANASLAAEVVVTGALITGILAYLFSSFGRVWEHIRWSPVGMYHYLLYLGVFLAELVKANLNVARLVFSPKIDIQPGIVEVKTNLKTPLGRLALANSITLTPGTLVVDIREDSLFVHWINVSSQDPEEATRAIASRFEKHLGVVFG